MGKYTYIPCGNNCDVAWFLKNHQLRERAFPFDWNITPPKAAKYLIEAGFEELLDIDLLKELPKEKRMLFNEIDNSLSISEELITPVLNEKLGIMFVHDFDEHGLDKLDYVREKYNQKIRNLQETLNFKRCIFVQSMNALNSWQLRKYKSFGKTYDFGPIREIVLPSCNIEVINLDHIKKAFS